MNPAIKLPAVIFGGTGYESANQDMPESIPEKYEMGTLNISGVAGLNAALDWIQRTTIEEIKSREANNRQKLIDLLEEYEFIRIVGNEPGCEYVGIVSCLIDEITLSTLLEVNSALRLLIVVVRALSICSPI